MRPGGLIVSSDGMRAYIRRRRKLYGYTQVSFSKAIGEPHSTYRDFESGSTDELKAGPFARAVEILNIPIEHIKKLGKLETDIAEAARLASEGVTQKQIAAIESRAQQDAATMDDAELDRTLDMLDQLRVDPQRYGEWLGYGRRLLEEIAAAHAPGEE